MSPQGRCLRPRGALAVTSHCPLAPEVLEDARRAPLLRSAGTCVPVGAQTTRSLPGLKDGDMGLRASQRGAPATE